jgi:undecaprenyl-diphosphatase
MLNFLLLNSFWKSVDDWDKQLFLKLNTVNTNSFLDGIMPWWRQDITWVPLYFFLILFALINFKYKGWLWILFTVTTFAITDQLSSHLIKNLVQRLRPCNDPEIMFKAKLLMQHCSGGYSFTSSHACNHFGVAMFFFITLKPFIGKKANLFLIWAATIAYGQIYVGVHYPLDVVCGTLLGCLVGYAVAKIFTSKINLQLV